MMRRRHNRCLIIIGLTLVGLVADLRTTESHPVAQGSMEIAFSPEKVHVHARVSMEEVFVQNALATGTNDAKVEVGELCRRHGDYLLQHLHLFADEQRLTGRVVQVTSPQGSGPQRALYDFEYQLTTRPAQIRVDENVLNEFDYAPGNRWEATYVVRVTQQDQSSVEGLLLTSREPLVIECKWSAQTSIEPARSPATLDKWRLTKEYVRHGIIHILTGYDHLLFIGALVLAVVTLWDLVKVITAFTLAHSITLTLSVLNIVRLPASVVEPMIAASIVFVALQNVFWPARSRGPARLAVAFFFGLFHGLGFAGGLLDAMEGMAGLAIGLAIIAFSLGVEIGHQIVVIPVFSVLKLLRWRKGEASIVADYLFRYGSAAILVAGMFYLVVALRF
jgi:hydrogenase/urease accessory protein HupE